MTPGGVLLSASAVAGEDEQMYCEFVLALSDTTLELRLKDRKDTVWMIGLETAEEALQLVKRWRRRNAT